MHQQPCSGAPAAPKRRNPTRGAKTASERRRSMMFQSTNDAKNGVWRECKADVSCSGALSSTKTVQQRCQNGTETMENRRLNYIWSGPEMAFQIAPGMVPKRHLKHTPTTPKTAQIYFVVSPGYFVFVFKDCFWWKWNRNLALIPIFIYIYIWSPLSPKHMQNIFINSFRTYIYSHGTYPNPFMNFGWRCMDLLRLRMGTTVIHLHYQFI